ncbi:hypothetical protein [uncultured Lutibacter sp.]|uniref:hypothetical protein n=1 Tax=uncultured Lutibacter sp. TaxID=437739 RepID=UPI002638786D|nr:hypothetical protein [uncultured Lutibacter sp.]
MEEENERGSNILFIIFVIIIFAIIYIASLGNITISEKEKIKEKEKDLSKLKNRHHKLKEIVEKKEVLNKKLNKRFKLIYFGVRLGFLSLYVGYNFILYFFNLINGLDDFLNYNELALIVISIFSFLTFGTFANLSKFIQDIKMKLEVRTYNKYVNIDEEIKKDKKEIKSLSVSIDLKETQLIEDKKTIEIEAN